MTGNIILFLILALVAIASAAGMLFSKSAVYAALYLIINFATVAVFYLLLNAPFIAVAQVSVYAGAIMVLFLFVIMLLGAEKLGQAQSLVWQRPLALVLGALLLLETGYVIVAKAAILPAPGAVPADYGSPGVVGSVLFTEYLLPFEITSILLLVAMVGAIVLTKGERKK